MLIGSLKLSDQDVLRAVEYEARAVKRISVEQIRKMIMRFYDFARTYSIDRRTVLDKINEEFAHLEMGYVSERERNWRLAIQPLCQRSFFTLKPKIHEHEVAKIILQLFSRAEESITPSDIHREITPVLLKMSQPISEDSPILRRAIAITGTKLKANHLEHVIKNIVDKYYIRHPLATEKLERLQCVVNQFANIPTDSYVWASVDLNIAPKHDWEDNDTYEEALEEQFHDPPQINELQEPFMKYRLPYKYVRKKQDIPWKKIISLCTRAGGTDERTIMGVNTLLKKQFGLIPYSIHHKVFDMLRVQGLQLKS